MKHVFSTSHLVIYFSRRGSVLHLGITALLLTTGVNGPHPSCSLNGFTGQIAPFGETTVEQQRTGTRVASPLYSQSGIDPDLKVIAQKKPCSGNQLFLFR